jgi:hypothetical protein
MKGCEMGESCSMYGKMRNVHKILFRKTER